MATEHMLWVDKYSPGQYTELLSDDVRECTVETRLDLDILLSGDQSHHLVVAEALGRGRVRACCTPEEHGGFWRCG